MIFYSHSKIDEDGKTYGSKELKVHITGVKENALFHFAENLSLGYSDKELKELLELVVHFHDLGKYTTYFQNYLLKKEPIDVLLKRHAQIGGFAAYNSVFENNEKKALLVFYLIYLHHSQLIDLMEISSKLGENLKRIIGKQTADLQASFKSIEKDLSVDNIEQVINYSDERKLRKGFKHWSKKYSSIQDYFLINYLFSLLIEADKLDASDTKPYVLKPINPLSVDKRFGKPVIKPKKLYELSNNELRNYCRTMVVSQLNDKDILDNYLFTLTAPTGIGKTMTALDFSLKLKEKIKQKTDKESRIIYALPFINIIEQALNEYKNTLNDQEINILGHYQFADVFGGTETNKNDDGVESNYNQKLMALDTWQADIVITSFVQFFETLIGNRNKLLKKFNHFAHAIIILDEVQTLRLDQMPLLGAALFYLSKFLKSRVILMTATRPKIFELAQKEILTNQNEKIQAKELLSNYEEVFSIFERTSIQPLLDELDSEVEERTKEFIDLIFKEKWQPEKSCLIVCNTVKRSIEVFQDLQNYLEQNGLENPIYYLSTNIIPANRFERIEKIRTDLNENKAPILIATQVVEAGVDLDFDMGFRDIGPIDSIIQVAGRINRNNDISRKHSPLFIVDFDKKMTVKVYGRLAYQQAESALKQQDHFKEKDYLQLIQGYFNGISDRSSFEDARQFFQSMRNLKYDSDDKENLPVSAFRIIEESDRYSPVYVETDNNATILLGKYLEKIRNEISKEEFDRKWKLQFQQQIISVPKYLCEDLETVNEYEESILLVSFEELASRYCNNTGYIRDSQENNKSFVF